MFGLAYTKQFAFLNDRVGLDMDDAATVLKEAEKRGFTAIVRAITEDPGRYAWMAKYGYRPPFDYGDYSDEELIRAIAGDDEEEVVDPDFLDGDWIDEAET